MNIELTKTASGKTGLLFTGEDIMASYTANGGSLRRKFETLLVNGEKGELGFALTDDKAGFRIVAKSPVNDLTKVDLPELKANMNAFLSGATTRGKGGRVATKEVTTLDDLDALEGAGDELVKEVAALLATMAKDGRASTKLATFGSPKVFARFLKELKAVNEGPCEIPAAIEAANKAREIVLAAIADHKKAEADYASIKAVSESSPLSLAAALRAGLDAAGDAMAKASDNVTDAIAAFNAEFPGAGFGKHAPKVLAYTDLKVEQSKPEAVEETPKKKK